MENKINFPNHESAPSYSRSESDPPSARFLSAVTHPSVRARNNKDVFNRIRSGEDILSKLPTFIDPNIQFSDDDDEESCEEEEIENKAQNVEKTPKMSLKPHDLFGVKIPHYQDRRTIDTTPWKPVQHLHFSACKPAPARGMGIQRLLPQSENKIFRSLKMVPEEQKMLKLNLMEQSEFKTPFEKSIVAPSKRLPSLSNEIIEVNGKSYSVLSQLGSGGSCKVYSVFDSEKKSLVAIKCVDLKNTDPSIREGYRKEIEYLLKLQGSNRVIKMYDFEYRQEELFLVLERGDIDFAHYISKEAKLKPLSPYLIKFYWAQMLEAVADIHKYGIVHSDLKPANFLLVAGSLKLIDFGIAASVPDDKTSTLRDNQVGTLNYMSPEAITHLSTPDVQHAVFKVGVKSDVWSLGCILFNLVYGYTPFQHLKSLMQKMHAIMNDKCEIVFKPHPDKQLLDVMKLCLKRNPKERASVDELLKHPYLTEDATSATAVAPKPNSQLKNVMEQMQVLTPRRMSYVTKMVQELSTNKSS